MDKNTYYSGFCSLVVNGFGVYTMMPLKLSGIMDGNSLWLVTVITLSKELMCALIVH